MALRASGFVPAMCGVVVVRMSRSVLHRAVLTLSPFPSPPIPPPPPLFTACQSHQKKAVLALDTECSFQPKINKRSKELKGRSVVDMCVSNVFHSVARPCLPLPSSLFLAHPSRSP